MPTNQPGGMDVLTDPTSTSAMNSPSHAGQHANANDAIVALEAATQANAPASITNVLGYTIPAYHATGTVVTLSTGVMYLTSINLQAGLKITNLWWHIAGASSTITHMWACLLDNTVTTPKMLANSPDTLATIPTLAANTPASFTLTAPFTTTYAGLYYLGIMQVATMATVAAGPANPASGRAITLPILSGAGETGLTTVASASALITPSSYGAPLLAYVN